MWNATARQNQTLSAPDAIVIGLHAGGLAIGRLLHRAGFKVWGFYLDVAEPGRVSNCFDKVLPVPQEPAELDGIACPVGGNRLPVFLTSDKALLWVRHYRNPSADWL